MDDIRIHNGDPVAVIRVCENCRAEIRATPDEETYPIKRTHRLRIPSVTAFDADINTQLCFACYSGVQDAVITHLDLAREGRAGRPRPPMRPSNLVDGPQEPVPGDLLRAYEEFKNAAR